MVRADQGELTKLPKIAIVSSTVCGWKWCTTNKYI